MAGTARAYSSNLIELGPGDLWLAVALPASGARTTFAAAADGALTPDATENATCLHLGYTSEGSRIIYEPNITEFEADESTAPVIVQNTGEASRIEGNYLQTLDSSILAKMMAGGTRNTGAGYEEVTWGGKQTVATFTVLIVAPVYADTTKVVAAILYKAYNAAGFNFQLSRKSMATSPFNFKGMAIASRAQGDQTGKWWKTV